MQPKNTMAAPSKQPAEIAMPQKKTNAHNKSTARQLENSKRSRNKLGSAGNAWAGRACLPSTSEEHLVTSKQPPRQASQGSEGNNKVKATKVEYQMEGK